MKKQRNVFGNPDLGLGQAKICDRVKPVNGIPTLRLMPLSTIFQI
jgi:hypothetical protein